MRNCCAITDPVSLHRHDHVAWCGRGPDALDPLAAAFFAAGVERNERMLYITGSSEGGLAGLESMQQLADAGSLEIVDVEAIYGSDLGFDPDTQEATFEDVVAEALHDGYSGLRVAADNTTLVAGDVELFDKWLAWEHRADAFEAANPVTGICYFDRQRVDEARLADLAALHPLRSTSTPDPLFQVFVDGDSLRVVGTLDYTSADRFRRALAVLPPSGRLTLDFAGVDFVDHHGIVTLWEAGRGRRTLAIRHARPVVRTMLDVLEVPATDISIETEP